MRNTQLTCIYIFVLIVSISVTEKAFIMLKGVVGLVTGGASGLGRATVERQEI